MRVIRFTLAYDGTDFRGWARQRDPGGPHRRGGARRRPDARDAPRRPALGRRSNRCRRACAGARWSRSSPRVALRPNGCRRPSTASCRPRSSSSRRVKRPRDSTRGSPPRHASTATRSTPPRSRIRSPPDPPGIGRETCRSAGCGRRLATWSESTTSRRSAGIPARGSRPCVDLQRISITRVGATS